MRTWRAARYPADKWIRGHADRAEERSKFQTDSRREFCSPRVWVEAHEFECHVWKVVGKRAIVRNKTADTVRMKEFKANDLYFQCVARPSAFDPNRASQWMSTRTSFCDCALNSL